MCAARIVTGLPIIRVKRFTMLKFLIAMHNLHYYIFVLGILLVIRNVETNPGPSTNNFETDYLSIVHINVCSLPKKVDIIYNELSEYDVISITETHLDNTMCNYESLFHGFQPPIRKDRNRFGGGLLFYISLELHFVIRDDVNSHSIALMWNTYARKYKILLGLI